MSPESAEMAISHSAARIIAANIDDYAPVLHSLVDS